MAWIPAALLHVCLVLHALQAIVAADPDAGLVASYTKEAGVTVTTTSGTDERKLLDDDFNSHWTSKHCLPTGYFSRADVNILLNACSSGACAVTGSASDIGKVTDGNSYTAGHAQAITSPDGSKRAFLSLELTPPRLVQVLSLQGIFQDNASLSVVDDQGVFHALSVYSTSDNYHTRDVRDLNMTVAEIVITSAKEFAIKELAAIGEDGCVERVTIDLGTSRRVGTVRTRHWAGTGNALALYLKVSENLSNWHTVTPLDPNALQAVTTTVEPPQLVRYLQLEYHVTLRNYVKVYAWEIDAWDEYGLYGPPSTTTAPTDHKRDTWDPDAGLVTSYTKEAGVTANATSGTDETKLLDDNDSSHWTSKHCLPTGYFSRADVNILLNACSHGDCVMTGSASDISKVTDGNAVTVGHVHATTSPDGSTKASFTLHLNPPRLIQILSIQGIYPDKTTLSVIDEKGAQHVLSAFNSSDNYQHRDVRDLNITVAKILLESAADFSLKELAAIGAGGCIEKVTVDLTTSRRVGKIRTRHWAGTGAAFALYLKVADTLPNWHTVTSLDPESLRALTTKVDPPQQVRYIQLEYHVTLKDYKHVYGWEVDAWDENGEWGAPIAAAPQTNTVRSILGVNGIWGWGHNRYSDSLAPGEGPELYATVASHARNYHNLNWDVTDPDNSPQYAKMAAGHGTQAKSWLNWDTEYSAWVASGMAVDASIQFTNKTNPQSTWDHPEEAAFRYGREFASHFGPAIGNGLVSAMEVGNEPWDYDASFYSRVLTSMAAGVRSVDPTMTVMAGAFQASSKHHTGNYIGTRVTEASAVNISVINTHHYSFVNTDKGVRIGTYPEHSDSTFNELRNIVRWRDTNTPNKPIWVTEWGWDAPYGTDSCAFPECVSEKARALYAVRGLMILIRHTVEKATWFFFANTNSCNTLFCRSGLTSTKDTHFAKTPTFYAFEKLLNLIGDKYFLKVLSEDNLGYIYAFGSSANNAVISHIVAWKPTAADDAGTPYIAFDLPPGTPLVQVKAWRFTGDARGIEPSSDVSIVSPGRLHVTVSPHPQIVELVGHSDQIIG